MVCAILLFLHCWLDSFNGSKYYQGFIKDERSNLVYFDQSIFKFKKHWSDSTGCCSIMIRIQTLCNKCCCFIRITICLTLVISLVNYLLLFRKIYMRIFNLSRNEMSRYFVARDIYKNVIDPIKKTLKFFVAQFLFLLIKCRKNIRNGRAIMLNCMYLITSNVYKLLHL